MGCDIHCLAEAKIDGKWTCATESYYDADDPDWIQFRNEPYEGRGYGTFAILANVRNTPWNRGDSDPYKPIAMPRGAPDDASPEFIKWLKCWGADAHSTTHLTLQELLDFDWHQTITSMGYMPIAAWHSFNEYDRIYNRVPQSYSMGIYGGNSIKIGEEEAQRRIDKYLTERKAMYPADQDYKQYQALRVALGGSDSTTTTQAPEFQGVHVLAKWEHLYLDTAKHLWNTTIPALFKVVREHGVTPSDVRMCFFFDN